MFIAEINGEPCPAENRPLPWQLRGQTWTATGYGARVPSRWVVRYQNRWRRVYVCQYSNVGTAFIGKSVSTGIKVGDIY